MSSALGFPVPRPFIGSRRETRKQPGLPFLGGLSPCKELVESEKGANSDKCFRGSDWLLHSSVCFGLNS
ncbi:hypothetical protein JTE90_013970 [Oedothorax gibbosus]|uniref:Uncharacterized protein n=1 Tax=Oedothorax gibbosus TaxID=931172 RepID=A0AAV6UCE5_9ARAC|nr:hypothetical protein JTE90_013970 [Oedothorax gibbosus]